MITRHKNKGVLKWAIIFIVILFLSNIAYALDVTKLQWDTGKSATLRRGETISILGYSVEVTGFNAPVESDKYKQIPIDPVVPFVEFNISKNGTFIAKSTLGQAESYITPDAELRVTAVELPLGLSKDWLYESYNPWVKLELNPVGRPNPEILLESDDEYVAASNTEIIAKITVRNTGSADLNNVNLDVISLLPVLRGELKYYYETIKKGTEVTTSVTFSSPAINELTRYNITVNTSGQDVKNNLYKAIKHKTILIAPQAQQAPLLRKTTITKMYMKDQMLVTLYFKNNANYELKNVSIVDTIPKGFMQLTNNPLTWKVNVSANGEWQFRYLLKPTEANGKGVLFPSATAELRLNNEYYMIQSNRPETLVYGPKIELTKQANPMEINPGEAVTITVTASNTGTTPTTVKVQDILPSDVTLLNGVTNLEEYIEANKQANFSYSIRSNSGGPISLPAAAAEYFELGSTGNKINTTSQELQIRIKPPPTPQPTPVPTVKISVNTTEKTNSSKIADNTSRKPKTQSKPSIQEKNQQIKPVNGNEILKILFDCSNSSSVGTETNTLSEVCRSAAGK